MIHAARKAGLVAVPLSYRFNADEMQYVIDNSDATLVIVDAEHAPVIDSVRDRIPKVRALRRVRRHRGARRAARRGGRRGASSSPDSPTRSPSRPTSPSVGAQMLYTSGTTGKPKGALRTTTDREIVFALLGELGLQFGNEVHITTGPLYHSGPLAFASLSHSLGCTDRRAAPLRPDGLARGW